MPRASRSGVYSAECAWREGCVANNDRWMWWTVDRRDGGRENGEGGGRIGGEGEGEGEAEGPGGPGAAVKLGDRAPHRGLGGMVDRAAEWLEKARPSTWCGGMG
jgi:hypothetical protein